MKSTKLVFLFVLFATSQAFANNFNSIKMSCELSGDEVSLNPESQRSPRIRKLVFPDTAKFTFDRVVYVSDGKNAVTAPVSFDATFDVPVYEERLDEIFEAFQNPPIINITRKSAQTTVYVSLSRENIVDLLSTLGSNTAEAFKSELKEFNFSVTRYFQVPTASANSNAATYLTPTAPALLNFTGRLGSPGFETCYQIDPYGLSLPDDPNFNQLSYHICGTCEVELLESSAPAFEPKRAD